MKRLPPLKHWVRGFESHSRQGCLNFLCVCDALCCLATGLITHPSSPLFQINSDRGQARGPLLQKTRELRLAIGFQGAAMKKQHRVNLLAQWKQVPSVHPYKTCIIAECWYAVPMFEAALNMNGCFFSVAWYMTLFFRRLLLLVLKRV
jgi:hypothetical protein